MSPKIQTLYAKLSAAAEERDWNRCASIARLIAIYTQRYVLANKD